MPLTFGFSPFQRGCVCQPKTCCVVVEARRSSPSTTAVASRGLLLTFRHVIHVTVGHQVRRLTHLSGSRVRSASRSSFWRCEQRGRLCERLPIIAVIINPPPGAVSEERKGSLRGERCAHEFSRQVLLGCRHAVRCLRWCGCSCCSQWQSLLLPVMVSGRRMSQMITLDCYGVTYDTSVACQTESSDRYFLPAPAPSQRKVLEPSKGNRS